MSGTGIMLFQTLLEFEQTLYCFRICKIKSVFNLETSVSYSYGFENILVQTSPRKATIYEAYADE